MDVSACDDPDAVTLARARRGHRAARAELIRSLQDVWYRNCLSMLGDPDSAREATQETALRFLQALPTFRGESRLKTWSLGIAINVCRESRRNTRHQPTASGPVDHTPTGPDNRLIEAERSRRLWQRVADLPPRQREAVVLRYLEGLSIDQTAQVMGCAAGTVKATLSQALNNLRQTVSEHVR